MLLIMVPSAAYIVASLALETWINRRLGFSYRDHMAMVFAASSSNNSTAIAIATAPRIRSYFGKQEPPPAAHPGPAGPAAREHKEAA